MVKSNKTTEINSNQDSSSNPMDVFSGLVQMLGPTKGLAVAAFWRKIVKEKEQQARDYQTIKAEYSTLKKEVETSGDLAGVDVRLNSIRMTLRKYLEHDVDKEGNSVADSSFLELDNISEVKERVESKIKVLDNYILLLHDDIILEGKLKAIGVSCFGKSIITEVDWYGPNEEKITQILSYFGLPENMRQNIANLISLA